ncbi:MAG: glycosyltransferase family 1 protein [Phycisphaeraceae bacterium]
MGKTTTRRSNRTAVKTVNVIQRLRNLAMNLRWTWDADTQRLFASLDPALWEAHGRNPLVLLEQLPEHRIRQLENDRDFLAQLKAREKDLSAYLRSQTWFARTATPRQKRMRVAYFCAEFALHESLPIYSGGLGVLAGDHLKSASDLGIPLVAVGLLYRHGYYQQHINHDGSTQAIYPAYDFSRLPLHDTGKTFSLRIGPRRVKVKVWRADVGRVPLFLMDTDLDANKPDDRAITHYLYGGDQKMRIRQEVLLGVGGLMALDKVGVTPTVCHLNEGHAAFCGLWRLIEQLKQRQSFDEAVQTVRSSSVFTTHTPVPAGHDRFSPELTRKYLRPLLQGTGLSVAQALKLGSENPADKKAPMCMTALALRLSERANGVAKLHGEVSREMWKFLYDVKRTRDVPIGHVTNGIHWQTWLAPEAQPLYTRYIKPKTLGPGAFDDPWKKADRIPPQEIWNLRNILRRRLVRFARQRLVEQATRHGGDANDILNAENMLREDILTIGFARRFATYKRAPLIFHDIKRLLSILNHADRPVQLIFAGKAHPADREGQAYLQKIVQFARKPGFLGRVAVLENYDMQIGRMLTSGCDIWLNNPLRPNEASGTSGMKPPLHGGVNLSILDGWWPEGYNKRNGFAIGDGRQFKSRRRQDAYDADCLYTLLEQTITPMFYTRNRAGLPMRWIKVMLNSMKTIPGTFNTNRMVGEYTQQYYLPAHEG